MVKARLWGRVLLVWAAAAAVAGAQVHLSARLAGESLSPVAAFGRHLPLLALWALATPAVLASARRFPVRGPGWPRRLVLHVGLGTLFVVGSNALIRLPGLLPGGTLRGPGDFARGTAEGLVRWYPLALVVYGVVVAAGHLLAADRGPSPTAGVEAGEGDAVEPGPLDRSGGTVVSDRAGGGSPLALRAEGSVRLVPPGEVEWVEADGNYVRVHDRRGATHRVRRRLSDLEERLGGQGFVRVHRSALVRLASIREIRPLDRGDCRIVLESGARVRLPRTRRAELEARLGVEL